MQFDEPGTDQRSPAVSKATARPLLVLDEDAQGQRLDNFLARLLPSLPKSLIFRVIRSGEVRVDGARASPDQRLVAGQSLRLPPAAQAAMQGNQTPQMSEKRTVLMRGQAQMNTRNLVIVFEDEALLVLNKPAGIAVHGGSGISLGVIESLRLARPETKFLELAHRLDRETSGLLVCAKKRVALVALQAQFRERATEKTYQAVVFGKVPKREKTIRLALSRDDETTSGDRRVRVDPNGLSAISIIKGLVQVARPIVSPPSVSPAEQWLSRVQVSIETGRTHQIRVHLASLGFPIIGDPKYGDFDKNRLMQVLFKQAPQKRMYLHAWRLSLRHPVNAATIRFEAPLPEEFLSLCPAISSA